MRKYVDTLPIIVIFLMTLVLTTHLESNVPNLQIIWEINHSEGLKDDTLKELKDLKYYDELSFRINSNLINYGIFGTYHQNRITITDRELTNDTKRLVLLHEYSHHLIHTENLESSLDDEEVLADFLAIKLFSDIYSRKYEGNTAYISKIKLRGDELDELNDLYSSLEPFK